LRLRIIWRNNYSIPNSSITDINARIPGADSIVIVVTKIKGLFFFHALGFVNSRNKGKTFTVVYRYFNNFER
jgi:hypothetical protein